MEERIVNLRESKNGIKESIRSMSNISNNNQVSRTVFLDNVEELKMYKTYNYDMFTNIKYNRNINQKNLNKIINSMKKKQHIIPIVVNKNLEIIDGGHRWTAIKQLGLPLYFVIDDSEDNNISDIVDINNNSRHWGGDDYLDCHIKNNSENSKYYNIIKEFIDKYDIEYGYVTYLLRALRKNKLDDVYEQFRNGNLVISDEEYKLLNDFFEEVQMFRNFKCYKHRSFFIVMFRLYNSDCYDSNRMRSKIEKYPHLIKDNGFISETVACETITNLYNYKCSENNKVYFIRGKGFLK